MDKIKENGVYSPGASAEGPPSVPAVEKLLFVAATPKEVVPPFFSPSLLAVVVAAELMAGEEEGGEEEGRADRLVPSRKYVAVTLLNLLFSRESLISSSVNPISSIFSTHRREKRTTSVEERIRGLCSKSLCLRGYSSHPKLLNLI